MKSRCKRYELLSVSNGALDDIWPKMALGVKSLEDLIKTNNIDVEAFFAIMMNQTTAAQSQLPATGIDSTLELLLSSIFIVSPSYGTRSTAIVMQSSKGTVEVYERNYGSDGETMNQDKFEF